MEVHAHTHTERKRWTHYLWEFLMLFLAVFCGFLAEYKLEQIIEHHKEVEYVESMIEDLQTDTTNLMLINKELKEINHSIDTMLRYYESMQKGADSFFFRNINAISGFPVLIKTDRTIQQLKSSGGMRLIKNKKAADGITEYDAILRNYDNNLLFVERFWENLNFQRIDIINQQELDKDLQMTGKINISKNYLLVNDAAALKKFKSFIYELRTYHNHTINDNEGVKMKAVNLMQVLKKEYHIK